jgi:hypothetical protein
MKLLPYVLTTVFVALYPTDQAAAIPVPIDLITHESTEYFYSAGGTFVADCFGAGCSDFAFSFGAVSGELLWRIEEKAFYDPVSDTSTFLYAVFNETLPPLTSFAVANVGLAGEPTSPSGWTFQASASQFRWVAINPNAAIPGSQFLEFSLAFAGAVPVGFAPVSTGLATGQELSSPLWLGSAPIPEPSMLLVVAFTLGLGLRCRWKGRER